MKQYRPFRFAGRTANTLEYLRQGDESFAFLTVVAAVLLIVPPRGMRGLIDIDAALTVAGLFA